MHQTTQQIKAFLDDDSFPPLVLFNGAWGEGKTFFTKNTMIPELDECDFNCVYFSLVGISNITDFRDRLISNNFLKDKTEYERTESNRDSNIAKVCSNLFTLFGGNEGTKIASVIGGATGLIKEYMLDKIEDTTSIIDDLDRIDCEKLTKSIVGECLQLCEKNNLKFVFVVNDEEIKLDTSFKEKVFSGKVNLNQTLQETISICFGKYEWLEEFQQNIYSTINTCDLKNLRVLKRASNKINHIYDKLVESDLYNNKLAMDSIIQKVVTISYYHYVGGKTSDQILNASKQSSDKDSDNNLYYLKNLFDITGDIVSFCSSDKNFNMSF